MADLSEEEAQVCDSNPIDDRLEEFCKEFRSKTNSAIVPVDYKDIVLSVSTNNTSRELLRKLFATILSLSAIGQLPSRYSPTTLAGDFTKFFPRIYSGDLNVETTTILLETVVKRASDRDIWCAVYNYVTPVTPTPSTSRPLASSILDTPYVFTTGSIYNSEEHGKYMDPAIRGEMEGNIYPNVPGFFEKYFDSIPGLSSLAEVVFEKCQGDSYLADKRWKSFPESCKDSEVASWFANELRNLVEFALEAQGAVHVASLTSRTVVAMPNKPLLGSTSKRKMDIGFARSGGHTGVEITQATNWSDILIPGELKENPHKDSESGTWYDLGRYVREVYASQSTRRFSHGFTICGDVMRVWRYDRGGIYSGPPFSINEDGLKFVTVMLGYLIMNEDELGLDTTIIQDNGRQYIPIMRKGLEERFYIKKLIYRQPSILGRGTTCWKATLEGDDREFVVKDSWQNDGKFDEGKLLAEVSKADVQNLSPCYHHETVQIGGMDDNLHDSVRKGLNIPRDAVRKPRNRGTQFDKTASSSSLRKRVSSVAFADSRVSKRSRSNTQGDSGPCNQSIEQSQNRTHKRVIMSKYGKPLYRAKTRVGMLRGLMGGISGHQSLLKNGVLHRDISIGNVLVTEKEDKGLLIDLDHAIKIDRTKGSGAKGRTGTKVFISIGLLLQNRVDDGQRPHSFMDDLESIFWLLFWICIHYSGPAESGGMITEYERWNYMSSWELGLIKGGIVADELFFLKTVNADFAEYYLPLIPWINILRGVVFPDGKRWKEEEIALYGRMKDVLEQAMEDPAVMAG